MKTLLAIGILTLALAPLLAGCAANACEKQADAVAAKNAECGVTGSPSATQDDSTCPDSFAHTAACDQGCIEKVSCDGYTGKDSVASTAFLECRFSCF